MDGLPRAASSRVRSDGAHPLVGIVVEAVPEFPLELWLERRGVALRHLGPVPELLREEPGAPEVIVLVTSGQGSSEALARLLQRRGPPTIVGIGALAGESGLYDSLPRVPTEEQLVHAVERAIERGALLRRVAELAATHRLHQAEVRLGGASPAAAELRRRVTLAASSLSPVYLQAVAGADIEGVSRAIHEMSARVTGPFVALWADRVPAIEHEAALLGAVERSGNVRPGALARAAGGTLLIAAPERLHPDAQRALAHALERGRVRPKGASAEFSLEARLIAATQDSAKAGQLRSELLYRISVIRFPIPALGSRLQDVPPVFCAELAALAGDTDAPSVEADALSALLAYEWPGDTLELRAVAEAAFAASGGRAVTRAHLPNPLGQPHAGVSIVPLKDLEAEAIRNALAMTEGNVARAAQLLGVGRATLYRRLQRGE